MSGVPNGWIDLLKDCWSQQSQFRPYFKDVLSSLQHMEPPVNTSDLNKAQSFSMEMTMDETMKSDVDVPLYVLETEPLTPARSGSSDRDLSVVVEEPTSTGLLDQAEIKVVENIIHEHRANSKEPPRGIGGASETLRDKNDSDRNLTSRGSDHSNIKFATELRQVREKQSPRGQGSHDHSLNV